MLGGCVDAPYDSAGVEGARGDALWVRAPGDTIHARRVEAPLLVVRQLQSNIFLLADKWERIEPRKLYK